MSPAKTIPTRASSALAWFLHSGIQETNGGVARFRRSDLAQNERLSSEITGYAVSTLTFLYKRLDEPEALGGARAAANFVVNEAWDPAVGIYLFELPQQGRDTLAYFFDSGIIVRGLLAAYRVTNESHYLRGAVLGGESMLRHFVATDGSLHPILRIPQCEAVERTSQWSRSPGCYQLKSAMAWHDLARQTGEPRFAEAFERALAQALETHGAFLPADTPARTMDRLHAYCYFLEALLAVSDRPEIRQVLLEGIERVSGYLREIRPDFERSDVNAQLLRVRLFAQQFAGVPLNSREAEDEAKTVESFQCVSALEAGGYWFGRRGSEIIPHANPVSTAFCSQALELWNDSKNGLSLPPLTDLI